MKKKHLPKLLYHYCSLCAFQNIVEGRSFWLSDISKSNDMQELRWIKGQCKQYIKDAFYEFALVKKEMGEITSVDFEGYDRINELAEFALNHDGKMCWAFCLSEIGDDLGQWRGYADDGKGIAIGFNSGIFELINTVSGIINLSDNLYCRQVLYSKRDIDKFFQEHIGLSKINGSMKSDEVFEILESAIGYSMSNVALFKQESFKAEKEWRTVYICKRDEFKPGFLPRVPDGYDKCFVLKEYGYQTKNNTLISHIELGLTTLGMKQAVKEIIIGPKSNLAIEDIKLFLINNGLLNNVDDTSIYVHRSQSSYR